MKKTRREPDLGGNQGFTFVLVIFELRQANKDVNQAVIWGEMKGVDELVVGCGDREQEGTRVGPGFQPG